MTEKYTPGPWEALSWEIDAGGTDWNVWGPKRSNHIGKFDLQGDYGSAADARLIAAAPDLLEACEAAIAAFDSSNIRIAHEYIDALGLLRNAVAKAEGRS